MYGALKKLKQYDKCNIRKTHPVFPTQAKPAIIKI
jgi:hypothetical protein